MNRSGIANDCLVRIRNSWFPDTHDPARRDIDAANERDPRDARLKVDIEFNPGRDVDLQQPTRWRVARCSVLAPGEESAVGRFANGKRDAMANVDRGVPRSRQHALGVDIADPDDSKTHILGSSVRLLQHLVCTDHPAGIGDPMCADCQRSPAVLSGTL